MSATSVAQGYILHEDGERVVIAVGFKRPSSNRKTGKMIQVYILVKGTHPVLAKQQGLDFAVCGNCAIRNACYVQLGKGPAMVWKTYRAGKYPRLTDYSVFAGRMVRWGAYGDPAFIPLEIVRQISSVAAGWTGYTHQWRNPLFAAYRAYLMASVETIEGMEQAQLHGWRTFRVAAVGMLRNLDIQREIICANTIRGVTCADCGLCNGTATRAKSIVIEAHGAGKRNIA